MLDAVGKWNDQFSYVVVEPLLEQGLATSDPLRQTLFFSAAELAERWQRTSPLIRGTQGGVVDGAPGAGNDLTQRLKVVDHLLKIQKELTRTP